MRSFRQLRRRSLTSRYLLPSQHLPLGQLLHKKPQLGAKQVHSPGPGQDGIWKPEGGPLNALGLNLGPGGGLGGTPVPGGLRGGFADLTPEQIDQKVDAGLAGLPAEQQQKVREMVAAVRAAKDKQAQ